MGGKIKIGMNIEEAREKIKKEENLFNNNTNGLETNETSNQFLKYKTKVFNSDYTCGESPTNGDKLFSADYRTLDKVS